MWTVQMLGQTSKSNEKCEGNFEAKLNSEGDFSNWKLDKLPMYGAESINIKLLLFPATLSAPSVAVDDEKGV